MGNRIFVPSRTNAGLGDTPADLAGNIAEATEIARRHITVAIIVATDGGWTAFDDMTDYKTWKQQK